MKEYVAIPPVFKAEQWDGTVTNAMEIFSAIKKHTGHVSAHVGTELGSDNPLGRLNITDAWGETNVVYKDEWVVLVPGGTVRYLTDKTFQQNYRPKPGNDPVIAEQLYRQAMEQLRAYQSKETPDGKFE